MGVLMGRGWHCVEPANLQLPNSTPLHPQHLGTTPNFHPSYHGFEHYYGLPYSVDMGCTAREWPDHPVIKSCPQKQGPADGTYGLAMPLYRSTTNCSGQTTGSCNGDIIEMVGTVVPQLLSHGRGGGVESICCLVSTPPPPPLQPANYSALAQGYAAFAKEFISTAQANGQPFVLYVAHSHVHTPQYAGPAFFNKTGKGHFYGECCCCGPLGSSSLVPLTACTPPLSLSKTL